VSEVKPEKQTKYMEKRSRIDRIESLEGGTQGYTGGFVALERRGISQTYLEEQVLSGAPTSEGGKKGVGGTS